jgi:hypothetical protein
MPSKANRLSTSFIAVSIGTYNGGSINNSRFNASICSGNYTSQEATGISSIRITSHKAIQIVT